MALTDKLTNIANAIRTKTGKTDLLTLDQMPTEIENIKTGGEDLPKITDASYLFYNGTRTDCVNELISLCEKVVSTNSMFCNCSKLTNLDLSNLDTSNVTSMYYMFANCSNLTSLNLSNFDTSNVITMAAMFDRCSKLTSLDLSSFNTSKVTTMSYMFKDCPRLTSLDLSSFDTSNVTAMDNMFKSHTLTDLDLSNFDMSKVNYVLSMFAGCSNLVNLKSFKNLGKGYTQKSNNYSSYKLELNSSKNLTKESLIDVITNGLYDLNLTYNVANGGTLYTQQLVLGSTNLAKLTADEIAIATNKGWTVS